MQEPEKNKIYEVTIKDVSSDGNGVGMLDGFALFIPGTVTGDIVSAQILKVQKRYAYARVAEIIKPSPYRKKAECGAFPKCGGCSLMHIDYEYQLNIKKNIIENALSRIGGIDCSVDEMIGADSPFRYRNKMIFPIGEDKNGKVICGFFRERSHEIIPLEDCILGDEINAKVICTVREHMEKYGISAYDEKTHKGVVRRIFTRRGVVSGEIMVVISVNADEIYKKDELIKNICGISPEIVSIILNVNKKRTNLVLGDKNILFFGRGRISDTLCGIDYEISPHSFYQINHRQTERLYKRALEYADISSDDTVMDIYCGIGTISLYAAKIAKKVIGVEIVPEAILDAKENAKRNRIVNAEFYCADAEELVPQLIEGGSAPDVVILDPPRKGSDEQTLSAIMKAKPKRIVYVSCNPATLARDLKFLSGEYRVSKVSGVDMFPNTNHVETVALLNRDIAVHTKDLK